MKREKSKREQSPLPLAFLYIVSAMTFVYFLFQLAPSAAGYKECEAVEGFQWFIRGAMKDHQKTALILSDCSQKYDESHPHWMLVLYISLYLFLQTFAIPGPIILSLISGALWPMWKAQATIAFCATLGASLCYCFSVLVGFGDFVSKINPKRAKEFRGLVADADEKGNLLYFMLFLRLSPVMPNWFVNLASPGAGVPLKTFALATFLGLIPANIIHYSTGQRLHVMVTSNENQGIINRNTIILFLLQFTALIPAIFKSYFQKKLVVE